MNDTPPTMFTLRMITDPTEIGMCGMEPNRKARFGSDMAPWRRVRQLDHDLWLWQSDEGSEGHVQTRNEAFTMVAYHAPDLRPIVLEPYEPPQG